MDLINDSQTYLSGSEKIKYLAIAVCGILLIQVFLRILLHHLSFFEYNILK